MLRLPSLRSFGGALVCALALSACNDSDDPVGPPAEPGAAVINANITANRTLYADTVYTLSGFVQVLNGATLTIQPGTRIEGDFDVVGSSLFITRGARIQANGTASEPIVFTSSRPVGQRQAGDWGGLIIIGNGVINRAAPVELEGTGTGADNPAQEYSGGADNADNSGTLRYVRVEFAGYGTAADQELNTFTLAAVGSGTTIEYVQALYGLDDAFEFFGGAVDGRYLVSYEAYRCGRVRHAQHPGGRVAVDLHHGVERHRAAGLRRAQHRARCSRHDRQSVHDVQHAGDGHRVVRLDARRGLGRRNRWPDHVHGQHGDGGRHLCAGHRLPRRCGARWRQVVGGLDELRPQLIQRLSEKAAGAWHAAGAGRFPRCPIPFEDLRCKDDAR
ncbi:MAG TPA: hypothetical protein VFM71_07360 [Gemmatimonadaceae bacterium]|nr:hypothetical protein [Gemmatimonadaceae bacterium]